MPRPMSFKANSVIYFRGDVGDKIYILPTWPKEWDVDFKLHAPYKTVVEVKARSGKITELKVTPASRRKDIIVVIEDRS